MAHQRSSSAAQPVTLTSNVDPQSLFQFDSVIPEYLDVLEGLPNHLRFLSSSIRQVDDDLNAKLDHIRDHTTRLVASVHAQGRDATTPLGVADAGAVLAAVPPLNRLGNQVRECMRMGEQKVAMATKSYDLVEKAIQFIDQEMKRHGASLDNLTAIMPALMAPTPDPEDLFRRRRARRRTVSSWSGVPAAAAARVEVAALDADDDDEPLADAGASSALSDAEDTDEGPAVRAASHRSSRSDTSSTKAPAKSAPKAAGAKKDKKPAAAVAPPRRRGSSAEKCTKKGQNETAPPKPAPATPSRSEKRKRPPSNKKKQSSGLESAQEPTAEGELQFNTPVDPNEKTYCLCNQVSFGTMVACSNLDCPIEWFHFPCVGIKEEPKGDWFCPDCTAKRKRQRRKK
ncbi:hypothetical protein AMAG_11703 [Allomyces macrogynus ATCC 38327]|uniref:Chromatin modification-related protein n=2 Tax=Allomyces macrogynus (strain ATCC 38327) TaxID=578462 RepID=A0A0L0SVT1_ALLM3|nr:hypothetical protein AMAG_11703 [Allomyces macrogynus ATCC 38327]|eukprot:KNE66576.1 hypothetical protein AMAG_11703 [Allomyces macrogynus ATCC 38327]